jgi:hypothetical protein
VGSTEKSILSTYNAESRSLSVDPAAAAWFLRKGCIIPEVFGAFVEIGGRAATVTLSSAPFVCASMDVGEGPVNARR